MEMFVKFDFAASRSLPLLPEIHPCSRLHGHTFNVSLTLLGEIEAATGFMIDFGDVEIAIEAVKKKVDHYHLNDIEGLENPTTEIIAEWLWTKFISGLPQLTKITVQEHRDRGVSYYGK
jgi:6-pyruvoyltetrahydropterin/6-carboxytetrahydropterin synthase|tara:strand:+ start:49 stop:405 length:357 start_codon:yes stop_codon:yes gene_type:complete